MVYIATSIHEPEGNEGCCYGDYAQAWATAWVQRAQVLEGKGHSGHIDPHQDSPAVPELILDSHLKVSDRRPRATLTTNLSADGLKRVWTECMFSYHHHHMPGITCLDVLHVCSFGYVFGIKYMFAWNNTKVKCVMNKKHFYAHFTSLSCKTRFFQKDTSQIKKKSIRSTIWL